MTMSRQSLMQVTKFNGTKTAKIVTTVKMNLMNLQRKRSFHKKFLWSQKRSQKINNSAETKLQGNTDKGKNSTLKIFKTKTNSSDSKLTNWHSGFIKLLQNWVNSRIPHKNKLFPIITKWSLNVLNKVFVKSYLNLKKIMLKS